MEYRINAVLSGADPDETKVEQLLSYLTRERPDLGVVLSQNATTGVIEVVGIVESEANDALYDAVREFGHVVGRGVAEAGLGADTVRPTSIDIIAVDQLDARDPEPEPVAG